MKVFIFSVSSFLLGACISAQWWESAAIWSAAIVAMAALWPAARGGE